jgi:hypothetical protein
MKQTTLQLSVASFQLPVGKISLQLAVGSWQLAVGIRRVQATAAKLSDLTHLTVFYSFGELEIQGF